MSISLLFLDTETTGLYPKKNTIHQLAATAVCVSDRQPNITASFNQYLAPGPEDVVESTALKVAGKTLDEINKYPSRYDGALAFAKFCTDFKKNADDNQLIITGYNAPFDRDFVRELLYKCGMKNMYWDLFSKYIVDLYGFVQLLRSVKIFPALNLLSSLSLESVCKFFIKDIPPDFHDARKDVDASIALYKEFHGFFPILFLNIKG